MNNILIIEDSPSITRTYQTMLKKNDYQLTFVTNGKSAFSYLEKETPEGILLDLNLPDMHGIEILKKIRQKNTDTRIIVVTSDGSIDRAIQCMKAGAQDFLVKPFNRDQLNLILANVLKNKTTPVFSSPSPSTLTEGLKDFIGESPLMKEVFQTLTAAASSTASVFISGESGVGKELAAQAIHKLSPRHKNPMIAVNCAAIPTELMQSEIFGHSKGAFTGAIADHAGAAEQAHTGTLFLDELAEMSLTLQTKFLRFLQTREYQRIGDAQSRKADIRFVAATNKPPANAIKKGILREDLYYRLSVVSIEIPPLRKRNHDITLIANQFLKTFNRKENKKFEGFSPETEQILQTYTWPGNVRELQNVIQGVIVLNSGSLITVDMLPKPLLQQPETYFQSTNPDTEEEHRPIEKIAAPCPSSSKTIAGIEPLWLTEKKAIEHAIGLTGGNLQKAAEALEVSPSTLYRKKLSWKNTDKV